MNKIFFLISIIATPFLFMCTVFANTTVYSTSPECDALYYPTSPGIVEEYINSAEHDHEYQEGPTTTPSGWAAFNCGAGCYETSPDGCAYTQVYYINDGGIITRAITFVQLHCNIIDTEDSCFSFTDIPIDTDEDGLPDDYDQYPNDPTSYAIKLVGYQTDDDSVDGEKVHELYLTDRGDYFTIGDDFDETKKDYLIYKGVWFDPADLVDSNPGSLSTSGGDTNFIPEELPHTTDAPTGTPSGGDPAATESSGYIGTETDSESFGKIVKNTDATNVGINNLAVYLKDMNKNLQSIEKEIASSGSQTIGGGSLTKSDLEEVIEGDGTNEYDDTETDSLPDGDNTAKIITESTRFGDRYETFTNLVKNSNVGSLADDLFPDIPTGGSSTYSMSVGHWGGESVGIIDIDYADYNVVWDILKFLLPILTMFSCVRIIILKG